MPLLMWSMLLLTTNMGYNFFGAAIMQAAIMRADLTATNAVKLARVAPPPTCRILAAAQLARDAPPLFLLRGLSHRAARVNSSSPP